MTSISSFIAKLLSARHIVVQCELNFPLEFVCACVCVCVGGGCWLPPHGDPGNTADAVTTAKSWSLDRVEWFSS